MANRFLWPFVQTEGRRILAIVKISKRLKKRWNAFSFSSSLSFFHYLILWLLRNIFINATNWQNYEILLHIVAHKLLIMTFINIRTHKNWRWKSKNFGINLILLGLAFWGECSRVHCPSHLLANFSLSRCVCFMWMPIQCMCMPAWQQPYFSKALNGGHGIILRSKC